MDEYSDLPLADAQGVADLLATAATYHMPAYAVLTPDQHDTAEEFYARPKRATLAAEGWLSE